MLRRNDEFWRARARCPRPATARRFGRDPAVFQYYPGRGHAAPAARELGPRERAPRRLHPPRSASSATWRGAGGGARAAARARLRRALDRLVALGARRDRFVAWEYYFSFGGGTPPWISGMTQGTAVQALARAARCSEAAPLPRTAVRALGAFRAPPPVGVRVPAPGGATTSCTPSRPACGSSTATCRRSPACATSPCWAAAAARVLYRRGERAARAAVAGFDTGAWSLYSRAGRESTLGYHQLVGRFLGNLCRRTRGRTLLLGRSGASPATSASRRGSASPRLHAACARERGTALRFSLSKLAVGARARHGRRAA